MTNISNVQSLIQIRKKKLMISSHNLRIIQILAYIIEKKTNYTECERIEDAHHILMECVHQNECECVSYTEHNVLLNNIGVHNTILAFPFHKKVIQLYQTVRLCLKCHL